jgi:hypothetical protein
MYNFSDEKVHLLGRGCVGPLRIQIIFASFLIMDIPITRFNKNPFITVGDEIGTTLPVHIHFVSETRNIISKEKHVVSILSRTNPSIYIRRTNRLISFDTIWTE